MDVQYKCENPTVNIYFYTGYMSKTRVSDHSILLPKLRQKGAKKEKENIT